MSLYKEKKNKELIVGDGDDLNYKLKERKKT